MSDSGDRPRTSWRGLGYVLVAALPWAWCLHWFYPVDGEALHGRSMPAMARELGARQLSLWEDPVRREGEIRRMRRSNAEWDFMGRTFVVLALANMAQRFHGPGGDPAFADRAVAVIDRILDETLRLEGQHGFYYFSMPYAARRPYLDGPARSQFVDSEILLMMGARRLVRERPDLAPAMNERARLMVARMERSPVLSAESYPDECWTFDNANALAGLRVLDALDRTDHSALAREWIARARTRLVDARTGLLVSEYGLDGRHEDGPEGSSIWMVVHALSLVDAPFAREQYGRARKELRRSFFGFDVAREWPVSARGPEDIDSGTVVPLIDASPASSGLALVAAHTFADDAFLAGLLRSLELAAFPVHEQGELYFAASNAVGDGALLYALVEGPLWEEVRRRLAT